MVSHANEVSACAFHCVMATHARQFWLISALLTVVSTFASLTPKMARFGPTEPCWASETAVPSADMSTHETLQSYGPHGIESCMCDCHRAFPSLLNVIEQEPL